MKTKNIFLGTLAVALAVSGCDEIAHPLKSTSVNSTLPSTPPDFRDSSTNYKIYKVLLEDGMGHTCNNCPSAVNTADGLIAPSNPLSPQIVMIEDNIGNFADTVTKAGFPNYAFRKDYHTVAGDYWQTNIFKAGAYPAGFIDRLGYSASGLTNIFASNWQDTIQNELIAAHPTPPPPVEINIHDSCWVTQRIIGATFQVTFTAPLTGSYSLETLIVEDSIIDWQLDNLVTSGYDSVFVHRNVLRGAFGNNTGGLPLGSVIPTTASGTAGGTWTSFQTYDFAKGENGEAGGNSLSLPWNMARCYIVAFVFNNATNATPYKVVQAEMIKIE